MMTAAEVERFIRYVPKNRIERRIHAISLVVLDTGLRITEVLNLRKQDVDLDNLLMKVEKGKGDRHACRTLHAGAPQTDLSLHQDRMPRQQRLHFRYP